MLQLEHVTKKYKDFTALADVNLELGNGVYGLLAPNGAGKTTLMKLITTLLFPTQGRILYEGKDIHVLDGAYREKVGYLPQDFGYYRDYTPEQYLRYIGILKGMPREGLYGQIRRVLELVGMSGEAKKKMKKFSGGMVQRIGAGGTHCWPGSRGTDALSQDSDTDVRGQDPADIHPYRVRRGIHCQSYPYAPGP